jgi:urease accessory protein
VIRSLLVLAAILAAGPAAAHGTLPGGGGFYAGALHPFLAWEHLFLLIALGLLMGRPPQRAGRAPLAWLALGLAAGLALGAAGLVWSAAPLVVLAEALLVGLALALALPLPAAVLAVAAAAAGLAVGLDTGVPSGNGAATLLLPRTGVVVGVFLIALNAMALAALARRPPFPVALRVAGSWIVAVAAMVLALQVRRLGWVT